ncbi:hypothetical protein HIM_11448 [Hirsutella minnesotensis 3608]|uniref:Peptidase M43 pregnancy-associated plasma-A domain-containing protein n=1 Tax=Hirsutella minnesotensis 3608 TaxID=1043627 RepID=A0A0F8A166_9HYPO|nr:hypothetical protein HIM_11448 [Hirsutella minnesotensis 3608]
MAGTIGTMGQSFCAAGDVRSEAYDIRKREQNGMDSKQEVNLNAVLHLLCATKTECPTSLNDRYSRAKIKFALVNINRTIDNQFKSLFQSKSDAGYDRDLRSSLTQRHVGGPKTLNVIFYYPRNATGGIREVKKGEREIKGSLIWNKNKEANPFSPFPVPFPNVTDISSLDRQDGIAINLKTFRPGGKIDIVFAHEVAHWLGEWHDPDDTQNLMFENADYIDTGRMDEGQILRMHQIAAEREKVGDSKSGGPQSQQPQQPQHPDAADPDAGVPGRLDPRDIPVPGVS